VSSEHKGKHPPQFVFEMIVAEAARAYLQDKAPAEEIAQDLASRFAPHYDIEGLQDDVLKGLERFLVFIDSVEISDVDLLLAQFVWYVANYENLTTARKKKSLFNNPLKGRPKDPSRVFNAASALKSYTYAMGAQKAPMRPQEWKPEDETDFELVFSLLYPRAEGEDAEESQEA
jgi:hypothetical protein